MVAILTLTGFVSMMLGMVLLQRNGGSGFGKGALLIGAFIVVVAAVINISSPPEFNVEAAKICVADYLAEAEPSEVEIQQPVCIVYDDGDCATQKASWSVSNRDITGIIEVDKYSQCRVTTD